MPRKSTRSAAIPTIASKHRLSNTMGNIIHDIRPVVVVDRHRIPRKDRQSAECTADDDFRELLLAAVRAETLAIPSHLLPVHVEHERPVRWMTAACGDTPTARLNQSDLVVRCREARTIVVASHCNHSHATSCDPLEALSWNDIDLISI